MGAALRARPGLDRQAPEAHKARRVLVPEAVGRVVGGEPVVGPTTASGLLLQDLTSSPGTLLWRQYGNKSYTKGASTVPAKWQNWGAGVDIPEVTVPGTPDANDARFYAKDKAGVSNLYWKNDAGIEYDLSGVTSGGGTAVSLATLYLHMGS